MASKKKKQTTSSLKESIVKKKLSEASLKLLKTKSWPKVSMKDICKEAKINPLTVFSIAQNKRDILLLINNYFDENIYKNIQKIENSITRDKIFEILMIRFEIFNKHRLAVIKLFNYIIKKPDLVIFFVPLVMKSLTTALEISSVPSDGILGNLKVEGLLIIYVSVFLVWKKDETHGLEKTMASIDNHLNKAEVFINFFGKK